MSLLAGMIRAQVPRPARDEVLSLLCDYAAVARTHDGCIAYEAAVDPVSAEKLLVFEIWRDQAAMGAHVARQETTVLLERLRALEVDIDFHQFL